MKAFARLACQLSIAASIIIASVLLLLTLSAIEAEANLPLDLLPDVVFVRLTSTDPRSVDGGSTTDRSPGMPFEIQAVAAADTSPLRLW